MTAILSGHNKQWHHLWQLWKRGRLPHALLFAGSVGIGKKIFTQTFVRALFCAHPDTEGYPCHACSSCYWLEASAHPDLIWVEPEKEGHAIKIDQIREVIEFSQKTALQGAHRVVVIYPATNMNTHASNALLKTLEEPTPHTFIILVSHLNSTLPATILSRCQRVAFSNPAQPPANDALRTEVFSALLTLSQGQSDPLTYAAQWQEAEILPIMDCFFVFLLDLLRVQKIDTDFEPRLKQLAEHIPSEKVLAYLDYIQQIRRYVVQSFNLNKQLLLEDLLLRWVAHVPS